MGIDIYLINKIINRKLSFGYHSNNVTTLASILIFKFKKIINTRCNSTPPPPQATPTTTTDKLGMA